MKLVLLMHLEGGEGCVAVQLDVEAVAACLCEADGTLLDVVKPQDQQRKR